MITLNSEGKLTQQAIKINRLRSLSWKMLNHRDRFLEKMFEHHPNEYHRAHCAKCWTYQCQCDRWSERWWKLYQWMPKTEEVNDEVTAE